MIRRFWLVYPALLLGGCATTHFSPPGPYASLTPKMATAGTAIGSRVRWGGILIKTQPGTKGTCFEILALPLNNDGEPRLQLTKDEGRFIACSPGFYDPALYAEGREITVAGNVVRVETHPIGDYEYQYPVLKSGTPHLWPRPRPERLPPPCWNDPFCSPWGWPGFYPYSPWWR